MTAAREYYIPPVRVLWWRYTNFGWRPMVTRNFYGGPNHVFTWGKLWIEWVVPHHD